MQHEDRSDVGGFIHLVDGLGRSPGHL